MYCVEWPHKEGVKIWVAHSRGQLKSTQPNRGKTPPLSVDTVQELHRNAFEKLCCADQKAATTRRLDVGFCGLASFQASGTRTESKSQSDRAPAELSRRSHLPFQRGERNAFALAEGLSLLGSFTTTTHHTSEPVTSSEHPWDTYTAEYPLLDQYKHRRRCGRTSRGRGRIFWPGAHPM